MPTQQGAVYLVLCAHCGETYQGFGHAETWAAAEACAASHQIKTYRFAPELAPKTQAAGDRE